jgi:NADPH:quinone reductase-like Zn-dependent oxidoreductase
MHLLFSWMYPFIRILTAIINKSDKRVEKMKAYSLYKTGGPGVLSVSEQSTPLVGLHDVKISTQCIGLNYAEIQSRKGLYGWAPKRPYIPGMEAFGRVIETGAEVSSVKPGDEVIVAAQYGCYAEEVVVPEHQALPSFAHFSPAENAAFAVQFMTAWVALFQICRIQPSDRVLIHAAAGGVGSAAIQMAKALGCEVYGTASSAEKLEIISNYQAMGINYMEEDFSEVIRRQGSGQGVDVVLEVVGGEVFRKSLALLNPFGRLGVIGFASLNIKKLNPLSWWKTWRDIPRVNINDMAVNSQVVGASHLGYLLNDVARMKRIYTELSDFVIQHKLKPLVGHEFPFSEMAKAHALMESRKSHGKIVVHV